MSELTLDEYIEAHIAPEPPELQAVYRRTYLSCLYPRMCSGHLQGRLLKMLTMMIRPMAVIELGAYTGYSAMSIAEGLPEGAVIHTIEADDEMEEMLRENVATSPRAEAIHVHIGDALEVAPGLGLTFDMAFVDANKRHYTDYLEMLLPMMRPGGFILADNTLWGGKLVEGGHHHDPQSQGIQAFNDFVARDPRLETVIVPLRDGLTIIRVRP